MLDHRKRYAIYYAPEPGSALYRFGSMWLGRDARSGERLSPQAVNGISPERWKQVTEAPRVYGFHATLKPPFRMAAGASEQDLQIALREFAAAHAAFDAPPVRLARLGSFLALVLSVPSPQLEKLAADAVTHFERFRMPASPEELERRMHSGLNSRQMALLRTWGYPYLFDEWRFHMSLTGPLPEDELRIVSSILAPQAEQFAAQPLRVDAVCLFEQAGEGLPFRITGRYCFGK